MNKGQRMLKKYYKKIDKEAFTGQLSMKEHEKKFDNFCDTIIDIDWSKILYNRMSFVNLAVQKFKNCNTCGRRDGCSSNNIGQNRC